MRPDATTLLSQTTPVLAHLGDAPEAVSFVARGAMSEVWRLTSGSRNYALRLYLDEGRIPDGRIDAFIRREVKERGGAVVAPILDSETFGRMLSGKRWSLEPFVEGHHPPRAGLPRQVCARLGETLAALHGIPAERFGRPSDVAFGTVTGKKTSPFEGVAQRFENPNSETWADRYTHPLLAEVPELSADILARLRDVSDHVRHGRSAVCHTDLHEKQIICADDELLALIDFGEAAVLDPHWDLGSVLYFHGAEDFAKVHEAYVGAGPGLQVCADTVASFSVAIAMHHASRSRLPDKAHRLARAIAHIRTTI